MKLKLARWQVVLLDFCLVFLFAAALIRPLFRAGYTTQWGSIESSLIADARFLIAHWPHPQWQPLWYAGTRFDYVYPPALRYGTALISMLAGVLPVKAYHFYVACFYCLGIAGVYFLVQTGSRSRGMAWLAAVATALMSPSFLFLTPIRDDSWMMLPLRLGVLTKYGEGPHMTSLALIPFALAFAWRAFDSYRPVPLALAALFFASVASNNFYGAIALLVLHPILVWSFWITRQDKRIRIPALAIPALAYGLIAFWLVPSYFAVTAENLKYLSEHGTTWSIWLAVAIAIAFALATDHFALHKPERTWAVFTSGAAIFFAATVLGNYYVKFQVAGEPLRLAPELDLTMILLGATILHWMWHRPGTGLRWTAIVVAFLSFCTTARYIGHAWEMFPLAPHPQERIEYRASEWVWKNMPGSRVMPAGSVRLWFDAWHDLAQLSGGSDQGILNGMTTQARWEIMLASKAAPSILWMQCFGVDATYVADPNSEEPFKETAYPHKYDGALPVIFDDHQGNRLYRVPRRYAARARVVETQRLNSLQSPRSNDDVDSLQAYVDVIEKGPDVPAALQRVGTDAMEIRVTLNPGQSVVVQESYDPAWHAWAAGQSVAVRKDAMGLMVIDAPPGNQNISLIFITPMESQIGRILTGISILAILVLLARGTREVVRA